MDKKISKGQLLPFKKKWSTTQERYNFRLFLTDTLTSTKELRWLYISVIAMGWQTDPSRSTDLEEVQEDSSKWALGTGWSGTASEKHLITSSNSLVSWETGVAE